MNYTPLNTPDSIPIVFAEAWNNRDAEKLASIFDEDADFVNVVGIWWQNQKSIRKAHAYGLQRIFNRSTLTIGRTKIKPLSADIAVVHARMMLAGQTAVAGVRQPGVRHNIFLFVAHRTEEGWRCAAAQNTDIVPGMETNILDDEGQFRSVDYRGSGG